MRKRRSKPSEPYEVGYRKPPPQFRFKKGTSGNPEGKRKTQSLVSDLEALLERALNTTVTLPDGEREQIRTKYAAGIETLVNQFVEGDSRARRDLFAITEKRGIDLGADRGKVRSLDASSDAELRQALLDRGIPVRLLPPIDGAGPEPPPDPPLPPDAEEEPDDEARS